MTKDVAGRRRQFEYDIVVVILHSSYVWKTIDNDNDNDNDNGNDARSLFFVVHQYTYTAISTKHERRDLRDGCRIALLAIEGYDEGGRVRVESLTGYALFIAC